MSKKTVTANTKESLFSGIEQITRLVNNQTFSLKNEYYSRCRPVSEVISGYSTRDSTVSNQGRWLIR